MVNKFVKIMIVSLMVITNVNASEKVSIEDMAKALEILIVDMKKQSDKISSLNNNGELQNELNALKSKVVLLEEASIKQSKTNSEISKKLEEVLNKPKEDHRSFSVESIPVDEPTASELSEKGLFKTIAHLKVHSEPSISSPTITYLPKGAIVKVIEERNGVALTDIGWVSKYYLTKMAKD